MENYTFEGKVFAEELKIINAREIITNSDTGEVSDRGTCLPDFDKHVVPVDERSSVLNNVIEELTSAKLDDAWNDDADVKHKGLVGLAFSGGGIRSATFNLGILQGLQRLGLFNCVDYLSTVSGGGYIGSCVSSLFASLKGKPRKELPLELKFPFRHKQGEREPNAFRYLRNHANYLAPKGFLDKLRIPMFLLRGIVINCLILLPYLLGAALITLFLKSSPQDLDENYLEQFPVFGTAGEYLGSEFLLTKVLVILLLAMFLAYPAVHMYLQKFGKKSNWKRRNKFGKFLSLCAMSIGVLFIVELQPGAITALYNFKTGNWAPLEYGIFAGSTVALFADKLLPHISKIIGHYSVYFIGLVGIVLVWLVYLNLCVWGIWGTALTVSYAGQDQIMCLYAVIAVSLFAYSLFTVDVNFTSIHKFYRDRLSKAYIVGFEKNGKIKHTDGLKLSDLDDNNAPYHLINTLLNLEKPEKSHRHGRHGDFFIFSKKYIGGEITGYCNTEDMQKVSRHVDLATAMAISGAAAAPNMGKMTVKPLVFILALLNVRLNYWLPNPRKLKLPILERIAKYSKNAPPVANTCISISKHLPRAPWNRVGPLYLIREMLGHVGADSNYINLSDGGHIENLGIYELLRRECRLIIAGDGEADSTLKFEGLAEVIRMALIDFGIVIEMDGLDEIRRGEKHHAIGTIKYKNGRIGKLIYLKLSMLGDNNLRSTLGSENYTTSPYRDDNDMFDDNPYIAHYKKLNPSFPHQSTGDQFFDEAQFECYRALGYEVAMTTLGKY